MLKFPDGNGCCLSKGSGILRDPVANSWDERKSKWEKIGERESFGYSIIRVLMDTGFISEEEAFVFSSLVFAGLQ